MIGLVDSDARPPLTRPPRAWFWPGFVIILIACQMAVGAVTFYLAVSEPTFAVEPDYYASAVRWDAHAAQQRENAALGWTVTLHVGPRADRAEARVVTLAVCDRTGLPILDASVTAVAFPHARATQRQSLVLRPTAPGDYASRLPVPATGLWEFRIRLERNAQVFTAVRHLEIAPVAGQER